MNLIGYVIFICSIILFSKFWLLHYHVVMCQLMWLYLIVSVNVVHNFWPKNYFKLKLNEF